MVNMIRDALDAAQTTKVNCGESGDFTSIIRRGLTALTVMIINGIHKGLFVEHAAEPPRSA